MERKSIISNQNLDRIQSQVDRFVTPPDVGRIPHKISSGFSTFTADQFKNWTLVYSLIVLKPVLPEADLLCWYIFFQACQLLCSCAIPYGNALKLNDLIICFCKMFEELYGKISCTPNLHLHCHLKDCIIDYGPASAFRLFACERLNGVLGSVSTNHRSIESQLIKKFSLSQHALRSIATVGSDFEEVGKLLSPCFSSKGSLRHDELPEVPFLGKISTTNIIEFERRCRLLPSIKESCLSSEEHLDIEATLKVVR